MLENLCIYVCMFAKQMLGEVRKYRHHEYVKRSGVGVSDFIAGIIELSLHYYEELGLEEFTLQPWLVLLALVHLPNHEKYEPLVKKYGDVLKKNGLWNEKHHHEGEWLATLSMFKNDLHYMEKRNEPERRRVRTPMRVKDMVLDESAQMSYLNAQVPFSNPTLDYLMSRRDPTPAVGNKRRFSTPSPPLNLHTHSSNSNPIHSQKSNSVSKRPRAQKPPSPLKEPSPVGKPPSGPAQSEPSVDKPECGPSNPRFKRRSRSSSDRTPSYNDYNPTFLSDPKDKGKAKCCSSDDDPDYAYYLKSGMAKEFDPDYEPSEDEDTQESN